MRFGGLTAVGNVSLTVPRGEIRAIIGPNGAGKSTFFNCVTGVLRPTSGRIFLNGEDVAGLPPHRISHKGLARSYQITNILPGATVLENARIAAQSRHHGWSLLRHHRSYRDLLGVSLPDRYVQSNFEGVNFLKLGMERSKFRGREDTMKLIEALEGMEVKESDDFPQGDKTLRKEDHQAFVREFIFEVRDMKYKILDIIPKEKTVVPAACKFA